MLIPYLGRTFNWVNCVLPTGCPESLGRPEAPFYKPRSDPIYASRIRGYRSDLNQYEYECLYPVLSTRLYRILTVINPPVELFPAMSSSSDDEVFGS